MNLFLTRNLATERNRAAVLHALLLLIHFTTSCTVGRSTTTWSRLWSVKQKLPASLWYGFSTLSWNCLQYDCGKCGCISPCLSAERCYCY